jgi:hypothetical protein
MSLAAFDITVPFDGTLVLPSEFAGQKIRIVIEKAEKIKLSDLPNRAERFAGALKLSDQQYQDFTDSVNQSRNEWNRSIY